MHGGGSERQLVSLLRSLDRNRFEPFLYLVYHTGPLLKLIPPDVRVTSFDRRVTPSRIYLPGLMHSLRVRDFCKFLHEVRADISYDRTFLMTLISAAGAQRAGVPNVSTIVTDPETGFAPVAGRFQWIKRRKLHRLYNASSSVLAVSDGAREAAIRFYGIQPQKIRTLKNGIDLSLLQEQSDAPHGEVPWAAYGPATSSTTDFAEVTGRRKPVRVVSAGRLNEQKGFHLLIDAIAELKQKMPERRMQLAILGDGPWRQKLEDQIHRLDLSERVQLPGFVENAAAWYRSADLFVFPSLIEGMPNVLLEAMALGVPVVAADCHSGPREILEGGQLGELVEVASSSALVAGIHRALANPEQTAARAASARRVVEERYSIAAAARQLEDVLTTAVHSSPR